MQSKEIFELQKEMVDWLVVNGVLFKNAMLIVDYCFKTDENICNSFCHLECFEQNKGEDGRD